MEIEYKIKRNKLNHFSVIFLILLFLSSISIAFFHTHTPGTTSDNCQICYLISIFQTIIIAGCIIVLPYFSFRFVLIPQIFFLPELVFSSYVSRAPPVK